MLVIAATTSLAALRAATPRCGAVRCVASSSATADTLPRILCLHGGGTNEAIMRVQTAKLRNQLRSEIDFDFLQGTMTMENVDPAVKKRFDGPFLSWYDVTHDAYEGKRPAADYIAALTDESVTFKYPYAEEAMARLEEHIEKEGPYDMLLGFSQGAILITLLTAMRLERARLGTGPPPSWSHNILVCGMPVRANKFYGLFETPLDFSCTVGQGQQDPAFEWCKQLADQYAHPEYVEYPDGHRFPHGKEDTARLAESIRRRAEQTIPV